MSDVVTDLLAALGIQAAGPTEVDEASPASTRGTAEGSGPAGRRQPGRAFTAVHTAPQWPLLPGTIFGEHLAACDRWRAQVAERTLAKDAADGVPSAAPVPDTDEVELEQKRHRVYLTVRDGDGVLWRDCPEWELDDLPQPVTVLARDVRRIYPEPKPKPLPIETLAAATVQKTDKRKQRSCMTDEQIEFALAQLDDGVPVKKLADRYWREWGFASSKSCDFSLRRRRGAAAQAAKFREEVAA